MELILQPIGGHQCGQYCVAMITGRNPSYVINRAKLYSSTKMFQWKIMLRQWGINCSERAKPFKGELPIFCMLRLVYEGRKMGHAVVYKEGFIYDPDLGKIQFNFYPFESQQAKIKSYLEIFKN